VKRLSRTFVSWKRRHTTKTTRQEKKLFNPTREKDKMATDEELEAKKVNDDKAPEGQQVPEKKKPKDVTAILERKKAPNRLVVGECS